MENNELVKKNEKPINLEDSVILNYFGVNKIKVPYSDVQRFEDRELKEHIGPSLELKKVTVYNNGSYMTEYANY
jgi:hypothetical protein